MTMRTSPLTCLPSRSGNLVQVCLLVHNTGCCMHLLMQIVDVAKKDLTWKQDQK